MQVPKHRRGIAAEEIRDLVGRSPIMLEIGCHEGSDTVKFLNAMSDITLFCFDCEQRALIRFKQTIGPDPRVTLIEKAVADVDGQRQFYASTGKAGKQEDWDFSGSLCEPTGHLTRSPEIKFKEPVPVSCIRLDTWLEQQLSKLQSPIHFIWADVQGSQRLLIAGAKVTLFLTDYLYIESHDPIAYDNEPTQKELVTALSDTFQPLAFYGENILLKNKHMRITDE